MFSRVLLRSCADFKSANLTVRAAPVVSIASFSDVCVNAAAFALSGGAPAGGTYSGTGVNAGTFDPAVAGVGTHVITYTVTQNEIGRATCRDIAVRSAHVGRQYSNS